VRVIDHTSKENHHGIERSKPTEGRDHRDLLGTVTALITVKVGSDVVESVITKRSAEELGLKVGDKITAVIKATEVMIEKN
jgi:molybdopterin-binding protein